MLTVALAIPALAQTQGICTSSILNHTASGGMGTRSNPFRGVVDYDVGARLECEGNSPKKACIFCHAVMLENPSGIMVSSVGPSETVVPCPGSATTYLAGVYDLGNTSVPSGTYTVTSGISKGGCFGGGSTSTPPIRSLLNRSS